MTVPAWVIALVRSLVQAGVGWLMSGGFMIQAVEWVNTNTGMDITQQAIEQWAFVIAFGLVVSVTNWVGKQEGFQWLNKVISLFLSNSAAVYDKTDVAGGGGAPDTPVAMGGENVVTGSDEPGEQGDANLNTILTVLLIVFIIVVAWKLLS